MKITQNKEKIKELFEKYTQSSFISFSRINGYPIFRINGHQENFKYLEMSFAHMMQQGTTTSNIVTVTSAEVPYVIMLEERKKKIDSL